jgi:hypothetical protein
MIKRAPDTCNGHAELCNRSYGNVTFIGTHNSYGNGSSIMDNQGKGVVDQLVGPSLERIYRIHRLSILIVYRMTGLGHSRFRRECQNLISRRDTSEADVTISDSHKGSSGDIHLCHSSCVCVDS